MIQLNIIVEGATLVSSRCARMHGLLAQFSIPCELGINHSNILCGHDVRASCCWNGWNSWNGLGSRNLQANSKHHKIVKASAAKFEILKPQFRSIWPGSNQKVKFKINWNQKKSLNQSLPRLYLIAMSKHNGNFMLLVARPLQELVAGTAGTAESCGHRTGTKSKNSCSSIKQNSACKRQPSFQLQ